MSRRQKQISLQIQKDLSTLVYQELRDPRLKWVNITRVEISGDLQRAKVYFTVLNQRHEKQALLGLQRARAYLRSRLAEVIRLRFVPNLEFHVDEAAKKADQVIHLLNEIKNRQLS